MNLIFWKFGSMKTLLIYIWLYASLLLCVLGFSNLFFSNFQDIRLCSPGLGNYTAVQRDLPDARSLAYDAEDELLFYTYVENFERTIIKKVHMRNTSQPAETLFVTTPPYDISGIAVDWLTKKIYFAELETNRVEVCDFDGGNRRALVYEGLDQPNGVAVWPEKGYLFVTDWGLLPPKIERFNMDGSDRKIIVKDNVKLPYTISVDMKTGLIYWGDAGLHKIEYMTIDGKNRKSIPVPSDAPPHFLIVYNSLLFWSNGKDKIYQMKNNDRNTIRSSNQFLGNDTIHPYGLAFQTGVIQPKVKHSCMENNGGCSHLCLLTPTGRTCACPSGVRLKEDGKTCNKGMERFLLIARNVDMRVVSLDVDQKIDVTLPIVNMGSAMGIDFDVKTEMVYWADTKTRSVNRVFLNGSGFEKIVSFDIHTPDHVAIDWVARNLYWTDAVYKRIEVSRMDGSSRKIIVSEGLHRPRGIAVDPADGKIYWTDWGNVSKIESADLDGDNRLVIRDKDLMWPNGITLDYQGRKLYWVDGKYKVVESYDLSTKEFSIVYSASGHPFGIAVMGDYIYWTDWPRKVQQFKKSSKEPKTILEGLSSIMGIKAVDMKRTYGISDCYYKKSRCSHLCFHKAFVGARCACPARMDLASDGKTCNLPSGFLLYSVNDGIYKISTDTYKRSHRLPLGNSHQASLLNIYYKDSRLYWVQGQGHTFNINHAFLNGSGYGQVVKTGLTDVKGLAIDWMAKNIYWTHDKPARIEVARLDGRYRKVLVYNEKMVSPFLLMVNPHIQKMFWFHKGVQDMAFTLWEANLDGSNAKALLPNVRPSTSSAIDYKTHIIYWVNFNENLKNSIQAYDRKTNTRFMIRDDLPLPKGLIIFQDKIIFADNAFTIQTLPTENSNTSQISELVKVSSWIQDIAAFHGSTQTGTNICSHDNGGCKHLCFALSPQQRVCHCATHFTLEKDGKTCSEPSSFLLFQDGTSLLRLLFDETKPEAALPITVATPNAPMDFDIIDKYLYWLDPQKKIIVRSNQQGYSYMEYKLEIKAAGEPSLIEPHDFALDPYGKVIFWTDSRQHHINFLRLDKKGNGTIFHQPDYYPKKILVHGMLSRLFWVSYDESDAVPASSVIVSTSLAGTELVRLKEFPRSVVKIIALDYEEKQIYWIDEKFSRISSMSLQGSVIRYHEEKRLIKPVSLAVFGEFIYWSDEDTRFIYKTSKKNTTKNGYEFHGGIYSKLSKIIVVNLTKGAVTHPCLDNNGGCSHICSLDNEIHLSADLHKQKVKCACPLLQTLHFGKKCITSPNCSKTGMEFLCKADSRCIRDNQKCDFKYDCSDGEDEIICEYPRQPCLTDDLMSCGIGCISSRRRCDGVIDCPEGKDELHCKICDEGKFLCDDNNCIAMEGKCNGISDCLDGSDEKRCPGSNVTGTTDIIPGPIAKSTSRLKAGLITGGVIAFVVLCFVIFVFFKFRNSKKNAAARNHENMHAWSLAQIPHAESINSDDHAKSSVSTYISAVSQNTEPSFYDRNNVTGASSSSALTDFSRLPLDPPPSPATERGLSTITETNNPFDYVVEDSRYLEEDISCSELGHDAPPPTLASTALLDDVDLYYPIVPQKQTNNWPRKSRHRNHNNYHNHNRNQNNYNGSVRYSDGLNHAAAIDRDNIQKQWLFESQETADSPFNLDHYHELQKQLLLFDPPPTPCTNYLSEEDDRPSSPPYSVVNSHFAPPPSPTSQL